VLLELFEGRHQIPSARFDVAAEATLADMALLAASAERLALSSKAPKERSD
jgi:hypothetical protein